MIREPRDTWLYRFAYLWVPVLFKLLFRMKITGAEHIPRTGPVVLASNHLSNTDPFFLGVSCPRQIHFIAKAELWKPRILGWVIEAFGAFPIRRGGADREAVRTAFEYLNAGAVIGIFPEGHRQRDGRLGPLNPGFALFSLKNGVVTIPVALTGTNLVVRGRRLHFPRVTVSFGPPLHLPDPSVPRSERARLVTQRLEESLRNLLGQPKP